MAVVDMQKICIAGLAEDKKSMLSFLMKRGLVDIEQTEYIEDKNSILKTGYDKNLEAQWNSDIALFDKALTVLESYDNTKKPLFAVRKDMSRDNYYDLDSTLGQLKEDAKKAVEAFASIDINNAEINRMRNDIQSVSPWLNMKLPLTIKQTKKTNILIGTIPEYVKQESYTQYLDEHSLMCQVEIISKDRNYSYVVVYMHEADTREASLYLKSIGFNALDYAMQGNAQQITQERESQIKSLLDEIENSKKQLSDYAVNIDKFKAAYDYCTIKRDLLISNDRVISGNFSFLINGWLPSEKSQELKEQLQEKYTVDVLIREPYEEEEFPVLLKNGFMGEAVSGVTEMFSLPNSREADPNTITSVFFALFFGMMLSDAGYGLLMVIVCGIILLKFKLELSTSRFIKLMFISGVATVVVGALYGSWFGNLVPTILSDTSLSLALWFDPLEDPNRLLMWSLILGVLHIYVGYGMKGYNSFRKGKYLDAILDSVPWFFFFTMACFMVSSYIPSVPEQVYNTLTPIGSKLFPYSALVILLTQGRHNKGIISKLFGGVAAFYDLISFLGDVLSYSRLLAMGLATGVIGIIINQIGSSGGFSFFGVITFTLVFLIGHTFNFAINALGAYVHSSRLQYIEFFNKFFEGGGVAYTPLAENTKYIKFIE